MTYYDPTLSPELQDLIAKEQVAQIEGQKATTSDDETPQVQQPEDTAQTESKMDTAQRLNELETKQAEAKEILSGDKYAYERAMSARYGIDVPYQDIRQEVESREKAIELVKQYQFAEQQIERAERESKMQGAIVDQEQLATSKQQLASVKKTVDALTDPQLAPFVRFTKDGYLVNWDMALKAGVSQQLLTNAGATQSTIKAAQERIKTGQKIEYLTEEEKLKKEAIAGFEARIFARNNQELPDGNWISKAELAYLKKNHPDLHDVLEEKGFKEANEYIEEHNRNVELQAEQYNQFMKDLAIVKLYGATDNPEEFDLVKIMQASKPVQDAAKNIFRKEDIDAALAYIKELKYIQINPDIRLAMDKGSVLAQRIADYQATNKGLSWTAAYAKLKQELPASQFKVENAEFQKVLKDNEKIIRENQSERLVASIKQMPDRLADMFVPFKATIRDWDNLSDLEKGAALAGDIGLTILYLIGVGQALGVVRSVTLPGTALSRTNKVARVAGESAKELKKAEKLLLKATAKKTPNTQEITRLANRVNNWRETSVLADEAFIEQLGRLTTANAADLRYLEKLTGIKGFKNTMLEASKAARDLEKAWSKIPKNLEFRQPIPEVQTAGKDVYFLRGQMIEGSGKSGYYFRDFLPDDLYLRYRDLYNAQIAYQKAMEKLNKTVQVRFKQPPPPDAFKGWKIKTPDTPTGKPDKTIFDDIENYLATDRTVKGRPLGRGGGGVATEVKTTTKKGTEVLELRPIYTEQKPVPKAKPKVEPIPKKPAAKPAAKPATKTKTKTMTRQEPIPIPREEYGRMTPEQIARYYGVETSIDIRSRPIGQAAFSINEMILPNMSPGQLPKAYEQFKEKFQESAKEQTEGAQKTELEAKQKTKTTVTTKTPKPPPITGKGGGLELPPIDPVIIKLLLPFGIGKRDIEKIWKNRLPVVWRQGFGWWVIKFPYKTERDMYFTRKKPQGAFEVKGVGSAYRTIQALGGNPKILIKKNLGIVDVTVTDSKIRFTRKPVKKRKRVPEIITRR